MMGCAGDASVGFDLNWGRGHVPLEVALCSLEGA
jgi:hypothetical protein